MTEGSSNTSPDTVSEVLQELDKLASALEAACERLGPRRSSELVELSEALARTASLRKLIARSQEKNLDWERVLEVTVFVVDATVRLYSLLFYFRCDEFSSHAPWAYHKAS